MNHLPLQRILHVEDDPAIRKVVELALGRLGGYEVQSADSAEAALQCLEHFAPQLLLLDVMMPSIDGPMLLKMLRARVETQHAPAIFMTAKASSAEHRALMALGACAVIEKPFDPMALSQLIAEHWTNAL